MAISNDSHLPYGLRLAVAAGICTLETNLLNYDPNQSPQKAEIVYLGDLLNQLNSSAKRQNALKKAWQLTQQVLIVAPEVILKERGERQIAYGGEQPTQIKPNYYYYQHSELKQEISQTLGVEATPLSIGVYGVFRERDRRESFWHYCCRSPIPIPEIKPGIPNVEEHKELLQPLMNFFLSRGRLPLSGELPGESELIREFDTVSNAFLLVLKATDSSAWEAITKKRIEDLLIYLASNHLASNEAIHRHGLSFSGFSELPPSIYNDILTFFIKLEKAEAEMNQLRDRLQEPRAVINACQLSVLGKKLPGALYIHVSALHSLSPLLRLYETQFRRHIGIIEAATLVKFNLDEPKISYLFYPDFDINPHPGLKASLQINLANLSLTYRDYQSSENPPILHRKETFVTPDYPGYEEFAQLTQQEERLGLLSNPRIGTQKGWQRCLQTYGVRIEGHQLIDCPEIKEQLPSMVSKIERHRAAIARRDISRPMRLALESDIFTPETTFFDYGCGYGGDIEQIAKLGYVSHGWDPYYRPNSSLISADVVNLGYVINVIEDPVERREALVNAWSLTDQVLIVSALVLIDDRDRGQVAYGDGVITRRNTFQKYYEQEELKIYIEQVLNVEAIPAAFGIYFVFREPEMAQRIRAYRFRSRTTTPRILANLKKFEEYQEMLQPLMDFVSDRGRLPVKGELPQETEIRAVFGTLRRAFQIIIQATNSAEWDIIAEKRRKDLLTYLAVLNFGETHKLRQFNQEIQDDIKYFFGSYPNACAIIQQIVYRLNDLNLIRQCCQSSEVGYVSGNGFYVHISAIEHLEPILRIYEGLVSRVIGRMDEATVIKFHLQSSQISYLFYPDFDTNPHPTLHRCMKINLSNLQVVYYDYDRTSNPQILVRKDRLVTPEYPLYEKFSKLTRQEENWGILDDRQIMYKSKAWQQSLKEHCAEIRHHRVYWCKDADPYQVKLLKSQRYARKKKLNKTED
jgi:DNA phosphorothioation-associated putative methyltransferase